MMDRWRSLCMYYKLTHEPNKEPDNMQAELSFLTSSWDKAWTIML